MDINQNDTLDIKIEDMEPFMYFDKDKRQIYVKRSEMSEE